MCPAPSCAAPANPARHQRHRPEETRAYRIVQSHLNPFLAFGDTQTGGSGLPTFVTDEFDAFLACGILAHGLLRLRCAGCKEEKRVAFSCPPRGLPSGRRAAASAPPAARGAWQRPRPIWWTMSSRRERCANGCGHSRFPCAVCSQSIPTCFSRCYRSSIARLPRFSLHRPARSAIRPLPVPSPVKPDWTLTGLGEVCGRRSGKRSDGVEFRCAACGNCRRD